MSVYDCAICSERRCSHVIQDSHRQEMEIVKLKKTLFEARSFKDKNIDLAAKIVSLNTDKRYMREQISKLEKANLDYVNENRQLSNEVKSLMLAVRDKQERQTSLLNANSMLSALLNEAEKLMAIKVQKETMPKAFQENNTNINSWLEKKRVIL